MSNSNSSSNIMSVGEMIDTAFGEPDVNTVNHKLIQTILYILARQLRILERRVEIEIGVALQPSSSSLSVTELKVHAMQKKKKRHLKGTGSKTVGAGTGMGGGGMGGGYMGGGGGTGGGYMGGGGGTRGGYMGGGKGGAGAGQRHGQAQGGPATTTGGPGQKSLPASLSDKQSSDKTSSNKTSSQKTASDKTSTDKTSSDKTSSQKTASDKTSTDKTSTDKTSTDKTSTDKTSSDKTSSDKTSSQKTASDKTSTDKISSDKTSSDKTSSQKSASDKTSSDKTSSQKTSSDKTSSDKPSSDKTSSDKTLSDKTTTDKTSTDKTSTEKSSSDKTTTDKTSTQKSSSDKTSSDKTSTDKTSTEKSSSDKTSSDKTTTDKTSTEKSSSDKTTSDKTSSEKTSSEKPSSSDKTSSDPISSDKTSSEKTSSEKPSSSDKTSSDPISSDKTSSEKTSSEKPSSSDKTSSDPTSSDKTSSKDKSSSKSTTEKSTSGKTSTEKSSSYKTTTDTTSSSSKGRADSREEHEKTPSPMASMDSVEATYEKLLVVERIPAEEARALAAKGRSGTRDKTPRLSVVTQEQFEKLAKTVRRLQEKFGPVGSASFPENIQLMHELRKGASLTDAMAALQLSARLEASEKALKQMMSLVTDLASKTSGIDLTGDDGTGADMQVLFGGAGEKGKGKGSPAGPRKSAVLQRAKKEQSPQQSSSEESVIIPLPQPTLLETETIAPHSKTNGIDEGEKEKPDRITYDELDNAMQELYDDIIKTVNNATTKSAINADNAFKMASKLEVKLEDSLNLGTRMQDLEALVADYSVQINVMDTSLSSQMTNYQEELTQMQHDLETALETMAEVLANAGGDTTAVAELNVQFSNLQSDIDDTTMRQKELKNTQNALAFDLESLRKQIEILRETKSDREEVADALRDKAGLGALNGLVSLQQFDAVRGDIEKRIGAAYDKFNSQETIWQKIIDDLIRELNEKADWIQVVSLKEEINRHLEILRCRLNAMMEIVGEPRAAAVAKKLHRDATCLSCATPADMELEEHGVVPALPAMRPPAIGAEAAKPKDDGDHGPCYPGQPIPHPRDPRSHVCQRWCGGSHTVVSNTISRVPASMIITPAVRQVSTALGTDGKMYMVDGTMKPCAPCSIVRKTTPQPSIAETVQEQEEDVGSDMTPSDFRPSLGRVISAPENETPPPPQDDD